jgi:hypothetical protein
LANLRDVYAGTALASLEWSDNRERAVDRVAASARAPELGLLLWKVRILNESTAYKKAQILLIKVFLERYRSESGLIAEKCVEQSMVEWLAPACQACDGRGDVLHEGLKVVCPVCEGYKVKRYTDVERAWRMKLSLQRVRSLNHKLTWLAKELGSMDRAVNSVMAAELERD